jgi:choline dehydrogenase
MSVSGVSGSGSIEGPQSAPEDAPAAPQAAPPFAAASGGRMSVLARIGASATNAPIDARRGVESAGRAAEVAKVGEKKSTGDDDYDYVIVGSGAGGAPLAAELAKKGYKVCVLEAGGSGQSATTAVPALHAKASEDPSVSMDYWVRHYTSLEADRRDPNWNEREGGILYPRGWGIGGSTNVNAMITVAPHASDFDNIAKATGDESWSSENMAKYLTKLERNEYQPFLDAAYKVADSLHLDGVKKFIIEKSAHGFDGWLETTRPDPALIAKFATDPMVRAQVLAAAEEAITTSRSPEEFVRRLASVFDPNLRGQSAKEGLTFTPLAVGADGKRSGPRDYLLKVKEHYPDRITIKTGALADKVVFDGDRAIGVEYMEGQGLYGTAGGDPKKVTVHAKREVILAAGAFNTPQILMLSGIGPKEELEKFGIPVRKDRPGVGRNLQDRYEVSVVERMKHPFDLYKEAKFAAAESDPAYREWMSGKGPYTTNGSVIALVKKSDPSLKEPDLFIFGVPGDFRGYYKGYSADATAHDDRFSWVILKAHTENKAGTVELRSADPREKPAINFRYFNDGKDADGKDMKAVVKGVEIVRDMERRAGDAIAEELLPGPATDTPEELEDFVKNGAWGHHACGTAKMGPASDPMAVVDSDFRVHGTRGLRVVDASVFPEIPGFFIVTPTYMISEKAADVIAADAKKADKERAAAERP